MSIENIPAEAGIPNTPPAPEYRLLDLGRYLNILWRARYWIACGALLGAALGYGYSYIVKKQYEAVVRLMPPDRKESLIASLSPSRNEGDLYLGLMESRTIADDVIQHQHLQDYFHTTQPSALHAALGAMARITVDKNQFITVTVRSTEPETSMRVANEFPQALYRLNHSVAIAQANHRREYFEGPLEDEKEKLAAAEDDLKNSEQKTGMVLPSTQLQIGLSSIAELRSQITARQAELAAIETGGTNQNPQVMQLKNQIGSLEGQLGRLQAQTSGTSGTPARAPALALEVDRKSREVRYHEALLQALSKQYENSRIDDAYSPPIELVDSATLPDIKAYPSRKMFALTGFLAGLILTLAYVCIRR